MKTSVRENHKKTMIVTFSMTKEEFHDFACAFAGEYYEVYNKLIMQDELRGHIISEDYLENSKKQSLELKDRLYDMVICQAERLVDSIVRNRYIGRDSTANYHNLSQKPRAFQKESKNNES